LTFALSGRTVTVAWSLPGNQTMMVLEAGTGPGLSNLAIFDLAPTLTGVTASVAPGTYYVRVRARNACGTSAPSNEIVITVQ
jgi:hypothetical protein